MSVVCNDTQTLQIWDIMVAQSMLSQDCIDNRYFHNLTWSNRFIPDHSINHIQFQLGYKIADKKLPEKMVLESRKRSHSTNSEASVVPKQKRPKRVLNAKLFQQNYRRQQAEKTRKMTILGFPLDTSDELDAQHRSLLEKQSPEKAVETSECSETSSNTTVSTATDTSSSNQPSQRARRLSKANENADSSTDHVSDTPPDAKSSDPENKENKENQPNQEDEYQEDDYCATPEQFEKQANSTMKTSKDGDIAEVPENETPREITDDELEQRLARLRGDIPLAIEVRRVYYELG